MNVFQAELVHMANLSKKVAVNARHDFITIQAGQMAEGLPSEKHLGAVLYNGDSGDYAIFKELDGDWVVSDDRAESGVIYRGDRDMAWVEYISHLARNGLCGSTLC